MEDRFKFRTFFKPIKTMEYNGLWSGKDWDRKVNYINFVLMQCTGLKDKNGKLIYEGDIVKCNNKEYKVIFDSRISAFGIEISKVETYTFNDIHTQTNNIEVIGNIWENKDLLKEGKE